MQLKTVLKYCEDYETGDRNAPPIVRDQVDWVLKHFGIKPKKSD